METITLPRQVVQRVLDASEAFALLHDELEDYFISRNARMVKKLRRARREHLGRKTRPFIFPS